LAAKGEMNVSRLLRATFARGEMESCSFFADVVNNKSFADLNPSLEIP